MPAYLGAMEMDYFKGRGAQLRPDSRFLKNQYVTEHIEGLDEEMLSSPTTQIIQEQAKTLVNPVTSPDLGMMYSANPYQGCEHGCVYCYARNTHEYWGYSAGLDFESKIIAKQNAPALLEKFMMNPQWEPLPISLSGNTDCYQPIEKKLEITRNLLKVFARFRNPVSIITKNSLVLRDLDLLKDLASDALVHVYISVTTLDDSLRRAMEPRTAHAIKRLKVIEALAHANVPVGIMNAPIIPGLNQHEIPHVLKAGAEHGAQWAGMAVVRLNGAIALLFEDWLRKNFPDRCDKVLNQIKALHGGQLGDSRFGKRFSGEGKYAESIHQLFRASRKKYFPHSSMPPFQLNHFRRGGMLSLF